MVTVDGLLILTVSRIDCIAILAARNGEWGKVSPMSVGPTEPLLANSQGIDRGGRFRRASKRDNAVERVGHLVTIVVPSPLPLSSDIGILGRARVE